ncbi:MAG TPA: hypothetical protein VMF08_11915 [Candidatus Sulfotelmatobacter sp.]|nr:hypothetical protein [Candidatus Sulfotelmatobacter sp.]
MRVYTLRFNLFLWLAALPLLAGCASFGHKKDEALAIVRIHMAVAADTAKSQNGMEQTVSVLREDPVQITIDRQAILTEENLVAAKVIDTPEAPAIELRFDENGTWILEQYSAGNPGGHFVIFGQWGKDGKNARWLAAPLINQRINNGILSFTPDMSRSEATNFVDGLKNVAKQFQSNSTE